MNRFVPGIMMATICLLLLLSGSLVLINLIVFLAAVAAQRELLRMICPQLSGLYYYLTFMVTLFPLIGALWGSVDSVMAGTILSFICISLISFKLISRLESVFNYLASACFATIYIAVFLSYIMLVARLDNGNYWLIILLAIIAGADTGAYYFGKTFGRRKLLPSVSPKKTIVGGVGGLFTGAAAALALSFFLPVPVKMPWFILAALVIVVIGMIGDLVESIIKRSCKIKDSGTLLGGHGGALDRIDSMLPAGPFLYYFLALGVL